MKYQVAYTDVYGNARALADEIIDILPPESTDIVDLSCQNISGDADVYLIGFEITRDALPLSIMDVLENLEGKIILCFAACGMASFWSKERVERNLLPFLPDECDYRGLFFCPGRIAASASKTVEEALRENPENKSAGAVLEELQRPSNHLDAEDLYNLRRFIDKSGICI